MAGKDIVKTLKSVSNVKPTKNKKVQKCVVKHEVLWVPDTSDHSRCSAVLYLVMRQQTQIMVVVADQKSRALLEAVLDWADVCYGVASNPASVQQFRRATVGVLLVTDDFFIQKQQMFGPLNTVVQFHVSATRYSRCAAAVRRGTSALQLACITLASNADTFLLRSLMKVTAPTVVTQRAVEGDVLIDLKQQIIESGITGEGKSLAAVQAAQAASQPAEPLDQFYSELKNNFKDTCQSSTRTKRKRALVKQRKQEQKVTDHLSDTESDDDSEEEPSRRGKNTKKSPRGASRISSKTKASYTDALTDVTAAGVKRQRNALTYDQKKAYKERLQNDI